MSKTIQKDASNEVRAVIYARVSTKEQEEGYSIGSQLALLREYCARTGIDVTAELIEAETAKETGRPVFSRMLAMIQREGLSAIVVEKTDRLYRNLKDRVLVDDLGIALHLVKEGEVISKDSRSHAKFVHDIKLVLSKNYIDNLSEETKKGMLQKARQGYYPTKAPLGYLNVLQGSRRVIALDPARAGLVTQLFFEAAKGRASLIQLTRFAFDIGLRSKKGYRLCKSMVHSLLTNPAYYGLVVWGAEKHAGVHEPLVDKATFELVGLKLRGRNNNNAGYGTLDFAYRGLLSCAYCGCALTAERKKGKYVYYHCTGNRGSCPKPFVREEVLTSEFARVVRSIAIPKDIVAQLAVELDNEGAKSKEVLENSVKRLTEQETKLARKLERLYFDYSEGILDKATYASLRDRISEEIVDVRNTRSKLPNTSGQVSGVHLLELAAEGLSRFESGSSAVKREVVDALCSNSTFGNEGVQVSLRKPFDIVANINEKAGQNGQELTDLKEWLPDMDSNHD